MEAGLLCLFSFHHYLTIDRCGMLSFFYFLILALAFWYDFGALHDRHRLGLVY